MDRFDTFRIFIAVAERGSFTKTASDLGLSKGLISLAVRELEDRVGARLFHRTTRSVNLTQDGQALFDRCSNLLADMDELENTFRHEDSPIEGRLRVDMPAGLARNVVVPRLPELFAKHPQLVLELSSTDRRVDVISEGFDCVVRVGQLRDSSLVAKPLGQFQIINCISPAYAKQFGIPKKLSELDKHRMVHYAVNLGSKPEGFEYFDGQHYQTMDMPGSLFVNNADAYQTACLAGLGLIQAPDIGVRKLIEQGLLIEVLSKYRAEPMPVNLIYASRRHLSKRLQVFMRWIQNVIQPHTV
jgi:DNA-binding transcriptional LysR family regulator